MATEPALPQGHGDGDSIVDRDVWLACAVPFSRVPTVGAEVYYFPDGHAEQHLLAPLPASHRFPCTCTVTDVSLGAEDRTDEVFAKISLRPGPAAASRPEPGPGPGSSNSTRQGLSYFVNELLHRDTSTSGMFCIPRYCTEHIFPKLDLNANPPEQDLVMRDTRGKPWQFHHIYVVKIRQHRLTAGWSEFVDAKLLVAGDTIVFMRHPNGDLILGLRRKATRTSWRPRASPPWAGPSRSPTSRDRPPWSSSSRTARWIARSPPAGNEARRLEDENKQRSVWVDGHVVKANRQNIWRMLEVLKFSSRHPLTCFLFSMS
jgi:hypothetical protein